MQKNTFFLFCTLFSLTTSLISSDAFNPGSRPMPKPISPEGIELQMKRLQEKYKDDANKFIRDHGQKKSILIENQTANESLFTFKYEIPGYPGVIKGYCINAAANQSTQTSILLPPGKTGTLVSVFIGRSQKQIERLLFNNGKNLRIVRDSHQTYFHRDPAPEDDEA